MERRSIFTRRLILRAPTLVDLETLAKENAAATGGQISEASKRWLAASHRMAPDRGGAWAIVHRLSRQTIGTVMYFAADPGEPPEISYMIAGRWRRKGMADEAMAAVLAHLFEDLHLAGVFADVALANVASVNLLKKYGFVLAQTPDPDLTVGLDRQAAARWGLDAAGWLIASRERRLAQADQPAAGAIRPRRAVRGPHHP